MSPVVPKFLNENVQGSIETAKGSNFKLGEIVVEDVLCAPGLDFNLVSGSQLAKDGFTAIIDKSNDHDLVISKDDWRFQRSRSIGSKRKIRASSKPIKAEFKKAKSTD
jgi:hypothetical protein